MCVPIHLEIVKYLGKNLKPILYACNPMGSKLPTREII